MGIHRGTLRGNDGSLIAQLNIDYEENMFFLSLVVHEFKGHLCQKPPKVVAATPTRAWAIRLGRAVLNQTAIRHATASDSVIEHLASPLELPNFTEATAYKFINGSGGEVATVALTQFSGAGRKDDRCHHEERHGPDFIRGDADTRSAQVSTKKTKRVRLLVDRSPPSAGPASEFLTSRTETQLTFKGL